MVWIYVVLGIAVLGLALIGWYVYVLYRKLAGVLTELAVVADRAEQALELLARIEIPDQLGDRYDATFPGGDLDDEDDWRFEARFESGGSTARQT